MATLLSWNDGGDRPYCELLLSGGERVAITLDRDGVSIDRLGARGRPGERLYRGDVQAASGICVGLLADRPARSTTPLTVLAAAVGQLATADAVRGAFHDANAALDPPGLVDQLLAWLRGLSSRG